MSDCHKFKTYEVTISVYGQPGNKERLIVTDTSEQKIYSKFLRLGLIATDFVEIKQNPQGA